MTVEIVHPGTGESVQLPTELGTLRLVRAGDQAAFTFERVFSAATLEDAMVEPTPSESLGPLEGEQVTFYDAWVREGKFEESDTPYYLQFEFSINGGPRVIGNTGSAQPMAVIARAVVEKKLPLEAWVFLGPKDGSKHAPIYLVKRTHTKKAKAEAPF